jgi:membrane-bound lytic murein transglycosylase A
MNSAGVLQWLKSNPEKADEIMNLNPAYTFFEIFRGDYVVGSQGVPLTPEKSLAVDSDLLPLGLPFWLETSLKNSEGKKERFEHLMIAQDTGSAIKGTVRGDIFFGYGKEAEDKAFYAAAQGKYFVLLPISVVDRIAGN